MLSEPPFRVLYYVVPTQESSHVGKVVLDGRRDCSFTVGHHVDVRCRVQFRLDPLHMSEEAVVYREQLALMQVVHPRDDRIVRPRTWIVMHVVQYTKKRTYFVQRIA